MDTGAERSKASNLPPHCPTCGRDLARVDEDEIVAIGFYFCGYRRMTFRDPKKYATTRLCGHVLQKAKREAQEREERRQFRAFIRNYTQSHPLENESFD